MYVVPTSTLRCFFPTYIQAVYRRRASVRMRNDRTTFILHNVKRADTQSLRAFPARREGGHLGVTEDLRLRNGKIGGEFDEALPEFGMLSPHCSRCACCILESLRLYLGVSAAETPFPSCPPALSCRIIVPVGDTMMSLGRNVSAACRAARDAAWQNRAAFLFAVLFALGAEDAARSQTANTITVQHSLPPPPSAITLQSAPASIGSPHRCDQDFYPKTARRLGEEGRTMLEFTVTEAGAVADAKVLEFEWV